jgi:hypothetical protein
MRFANDKFFIYAQILMDKRKLMRLLGVFQQAAAVFEMVGKRARENLVRTLSLLINDGSSSSFPTPSSCASLK